MEKADEEWLSRLRRRALAGNAVAQHELGWLCESGAVRESEDQVDLDQLFRHDVDEYAFCDFEEAAKWYRLAATGGDVRARKRLAIWEKHCTQVSAAVPKDHKDALQRYLRAAEQQGDAFAHCNVARYHALGIGRDDGKVDLNEAMKWFRKAADQGDAEAQFELGNCYANGEGVDEERDVDQATHWFRLAANQGHAAAQYQLACTLEYNDADDRDDDMAEIAELYRAAAEQGHAEAQCELGNCLFNGVGVERDIEQAIAWYRRAADQFHAAAHHNLALCYEAGEGVDQDREKAAEHYRMAAEAADGIAERRLLSMKQSEKTADETAEMDTDNHASDAMDFLRNRAVSGDHNAQHDLGRKFELGIDVECNFAEANSWYRMSADHGNQFAIKRLAIWQRPGDDGIIHLPTDHAAAFALYQRAATQHNDAQAHFDLGMHFYLGKGTEQNHGGAAKYFRLAADQGHVDAQVQLALCYEGGEGVEEDIQQAAKWYRRAAKQSDAFAQSHLASLHEVGVGVPKNVTEAFKLYRKAAKQGNPNHQIQLAESCFQGFGPKESWRDAHKWLATAEQAHKSSGSLKRRFAESTEIATSLRWYRMAAELGDLVAQSRLAHLLHKIEGTKKDKEEAIKWYRIATQAGDLESARELGHIYEAGDGVKKDLQQAYKYHTLAAEMFIDGEEAFSLAEFLESNNDGDNQKIIEAFRMYQVAAAAQNNRAMFKVAEFYELGKGGVEKNTEEAIRMYRKIAADKDHANIDTRFKANKKVAERFSHMEDLDPELVTVFNNFLDLAQGYRPHVEAMYQVYIRYNLGRGVAEDSYKAHKWLVNAARGGHVDACLRLAEDVWEDEESKRYWHRQAVMNGHPPEYVEAEIECIKMSKCGDKVGVLKYGVDDVTLSIADQELDISNWSTCEIALLPAGDRCVLATHDGLILRSLFQTPGVNDNIIGLERQNNKVDLIAWSTSDVIATTSNNHKQIISLWQTDGKRIGTLHGHSDKIVAIDISPNGWHLASCSRDNTFRIWDIASGICLQVFQVQDQNYVAVAFSPNGAMLATNSRDGKVVVRDTHDWTELLSLGDHRKYVSLDWSPNSKYLVTADRERLRVFSFNRANLGECVFEKKGWQNEAAFSPVINQIWFAEIGNLELNKIEVPFDIISDEVPLPVEKLPLPSSFASTNELQEQMERLAVLVERIDHPHALHQLIRLLSAINTSDLNPLAALAHLRAEIEANLGNQTFEQAVAMIKEYENAKQSIAALSSLETISVLTTKVDASATPQPLSFQEIHAIFSFVRTQCWMVPRLEGDLLEATKTFSDSLDKTDRHAADLAEQVGKHLESLSAFVVHLSQSSSDLFAKVDQIKSIFEVVHGKTDSLGKSHKDIARLFADLSSSFARLPHPSSVKSGHQNMPASALQMDHSSSSDALERNSNDMEIDRRDLFTSSAPTSQEVRELKIARVYREADIDIDHIALSADGKLFAASSEYGFFLFNSETDVEIWHLDICSLWSAFSPDGSSVVVAHCMDERLRNYEMKIYHSHTGEVKLAFPCIFSSIGSLLWSTTDIILSCCRYKNEGRRTPKSVKLWHPDGTCHPALSEHLAKMREPYAFSPNGDKLVSIHSNEMHIWDIASGALLHSSDELTSASCCKVVFSPNGKMFAVCFHNGKVWIFDTSTWERRHQIKLNESWKNDGDIQVAWSPSSEFLAASSQNESRLISIVRVSDLKTHSFRQPQGVRFIQFAANGDELLVACNNMSLRRLRLPFTTYSTSTPSSYDTDLPSFGKLPMLHSSSSAVVGTAEAKLKQWQLSLNSQSPTGIENIQRLVRLVQAIKSTGFKSAAQMMAAAGHVESELQKVNSIVDSITQHQQSNEVSPYQQRQACKNLRKILSQLVDPVKQLNIHTSSLKHMQQQIISGSKHDSVPPRELTANELRDIFTFAWKHGQQLQMQMRSTINAGEEMAKAVIAYDESAGMLREEVENNLAKLNGYLAHFNRCATEPDMTATFSNALQQARQTITSSIETQREPKRRKLTVET